MTITQCFRLKWPGRPSLFGLQPTSDYQSLISHSASELSAKAWKRTGRDLRVAIQQFESRNPDAQRIDDCPLQN